MQFSSTVERDKKQKYSQACQDRKAIFTPMCVSVDGMLGCEATAFLKQIGDMLSAKWKMDHETVMGWVRARLSLRSFMLHCCVFGGLYYIVCS